MKLKMHSQHEFTPEDLAETLAKGTPSDFAKFWLEFSRLAGEMTMREFAKAMAPQTVEIGNTVLSELHNSLTITK